MMHIMRATTSKEKQDQHKRRQTDQYIARKNQKIENAIYGALTYQCSHCPNTIRVNEELVDRKILCTKCNGLFKKLVKDDRKNIATKDDFPKSKPPSKNKSVKRARKNNKKTKEQE